MAVRSTLKGKVTVFQTGQVNPIQANGGYPTEIAKANGVSGKALAELRKSK